MKVKLFITSSLMLLGLWLTAAFFHNVDMTSYVSNQPMSSETELSSSQTSSGPQQTKLDSDQTNNSATALK